MWLDAEALARLGDRLAGAIEAARGRGRATLASVTVALDPALDPATVVCSSRTAEEPWFCFEQPARDGAALAGLGCVSALETDGAQRFVSVAKQWRGLIADSCVDGPDGPAGSGPVAVGGFSFAPDGGATPQWAGFAAASLIVPELVLSRRQGHGRLTVCCLADPDDLVSELLARVQARLAGLRHDAPALLDPDPIHRARVSATMPPEHYETAVARAVEHIRAGELEKIVLAREVEVHAATPHDPAAILAVLREAFPACFVFCVGRGNATFLGASPELLLRRDGMRAATLALAGSTRRSADPSVDDHLGEQLLRSSKDREEQAIVVRRIEQTLRPRAVWVTSAPDPVLVRVANIQHLGTPIRAQLAAPVSAVELAGMLHPTPAVGGEPWERAAPLIPALEGMDRGWYAGPVGWTDANEDGEFCVALRCALLRGPVARCYAGVGVVRDSDPDAELAETELKLAALLPVLAG